jgi:hypothetical protein
MTSEDAKQYIPLLTGEGNLPTWRSVVRRSFIMNGLWEYLVTDIPKPTNPEELKKWTRDRVQASLILQKSLLHPHIERMLVNNGLDMEEDDPKAIWDLVNQVIPTVTKASMSSLLYEFTRLDRKSFGTLFDYINKVQEINKRLKSTGCDLQESVIIAMTLWGLKSTYPNDHNFWIRGFETGTLKWAELMKELGRIALDEQIRPMMLSLPAKNTDNAQGSGQNNNKDGGKMKRCTKPGCKFMCYPGQDHLDCTHHGPKNQAFCQWCEPEKAPDSWKGKAKALTKKKERQERESQNQTSTTSVVVHGSSGLYHPSTTSSNLLFSDLSLAAITEDYPRINPGDGLASIEKDFSHEPPLHLMPSVSSEVQQALKAHNSMNSDTVIVDSGAHMSTFNHLKWFTELQPMPQARGFKSSTGGMGYAYYWGSVEVNIPLVNGNLVRITLSHAMYYPDSPINLVGRDSLKAAGISWDFDDNHLINKTGKGAWQRLQCLEDGGLPIIPVQAPPDFNEQVVTPTHAVMASINYRVMHRRLMHAGKNTVLRACKAAGIDLADIKGEEFCEDCILSKSTDTRQKVAARVASKPLEFVRVDVMVHDQPGHLGYKYTVHFVDVVSSFHWARFTKTKGDAYIHIIEFFDMVETQTGIKIKVFGFDGGSEFGQGVKEWENGKIYTWAKSKGVEIYKTTAETPWMNGKSERAGRTICERARAIMIQHKIPQLLWPFVVDSVVKVLNLLPCSANPEHQSPHEVFCRSVNMPEEAIKPYIKHLRSYFCDAYYFIKPAHRTQANKFEPRARKAKLIAYGDLHGRIYTLWDPVLRKIVRANSVRFNEDQSIEDDDGDEPLGVTFTDHTVAEIERDIELVEVKFAESRSQSTKTSTPSTVITPQEQSQQRSAGPPAVEPPEASLHTPKDQHYLPSPTASPPPISHPQGARTQPEGEPQHSSSEEEDGPFDAGDNDEIDEEAPIPRRFAQYHSPEPGRVEESITVRLPAPEEAQNKLTKPWNQANPPVQPTRVNNGPPITPPIPGGEVPAPEPQGVGRPKRAAAQKDPGHYKALNEGKVQFQGYHGPGILHPPEKLILPVEYVLTSVKVTHDLNTIDKSTIPKNYRQAQRMENFPTYWHPAINLQGQSLRDKGVYEMVMRYPGMEILPGKWVFDEKMDPKTCKFVARARYVVCGNFEGTTWSSQEVYAAVANSVSFRTFMAIVATQDLECWQYDFKTAFLNARIPEGHTYYVEPPPGLPFDSRYVWKLKKALYGLRRAPLYWFQALIPVMESLGFTALGVDTCLFIHEEKGILVILYVDDMLVAAANRTDIESIMKAMGEVFDLKELGEVQRFLGFDVVRDRQERTVFLSQEAYTRMMLNKYDYEDLKPALTPFPPKFELPKQWEPLTKETKLYVKKTGSLNYLSTGTRPDITFTVSRLCEANFGPSEAHLHLVKHLYRYLTGTASLGILLGGKLPLDRLNLLGFADASFADDLMTRFSTAGHVVFIAGGPILWKSKKQTFVAASTTEAEFANLTPAAQSILWVLRILSEFGAAQPRPTVLYTDSANAHTIVLNPNNTARTRHLDIRYKWIVDRVKKGDVTVKHIRGEEMAADGLTKPLLPDKHAKFVKQLGLVSKRIPWTN